MQNKNWDRKTQNKKYLLLTTCPLTIILWIFVERWNKTEIKRRSWTQRYTKKLMSGWKGLGGGAVFQVLPIQIFLRTGFFLHHPISSLFFLTSSEKTPKPPVCKILMGWDEIPCFGRRMFNVASCRNAVGCPRDSCLLHFLAPRSCCHLQRQRISHYNKAVILPSLQTSLFISSRRLIKGKVITNCSINIRSNGLVKWLVVPHKTNEKQNHWCTTSSTVH